VERNPAADAQVGWSVSDDHGRGANRLADETSPYLLQHRGNPVDWYPWGPEALARARAESKPIFLSVGYAACHWCHVMAHESFDDPAVAALLNASFVPVKVDREERPDVDSVYMSAVQAMTGRGGWPLSVFLTPELEPFYGGTYFPPERRHGMPSFTEVLTAVADAWRRDGSGVAAQARHLLEQLAAHDERDRAGTPDPERAARAALDQLARSYDVRWGGFGSAPKFPTPSRLYFLLARARVGDTTARQLLTGTLEGMAAGGMWDVIGGGFHRYSVDERWLVPHFEKMLYDNALLARLYGEAGVALDRSEWLAVARATADYLLREMRGDEGGFFSATDADSEGEEGRFFTWTPDEVREALPADLAALVVEFFGFDDRPNFEERFVLRPVVTPSELAAAHGIGVEAIESRLAEARRLLYERRAQRVPPLTDDKRLAGWNGMAVWALAHLGALLDEPGYLATAQRAGRFLLGTMTRPDGGLHRSWRHGRVTGAETLEDVAWVAAGLVELYQADGDTAWLRAALRTVDARLPHYRDAAGAMFEAPDDGEPLPLRPRNPWDGAIPAAPAVMAATLTRLAALTARADPAEAALRSVAAEALLLERSPENATGMIGAAAIALTPPTQLVVVGEPYAPATRALLAAARRALHPPTVVAPASAVPVSDSDVDLVPLFAGRESVEPGTALAYLCRNGACRLPTSDPDALARALTEPD
jgi:hypothetical protein